MSVLRAQPLASTAAAQRRPARTNRASQRPRWKHADCGQLSTERRGDVASRGSRHAGRGAERGGEGRRLTCACQALRPSLRAVRWKEGAVAAVRRARLRASWAAAMGTLLGTRRSWGWRKGGAAAGATGARIGGTMAAGRGAAKPPSRPSVGASCSGVAVGSLGKRRSACDRPRPLLCAPRPATSSAAATRRRPSRAPSPSPCPHQPAVQREQRDGAASTGLGIRCQNRAGGWSRRTRFLRIRPGGELRYRLRCWFWARS